MIFVVDDSVFERPVRNSLFSERGVLCILLKLRRLYPGIRPVEASRLLSKMRPLLDEPASDRRATTSPPTSARRLPFPEISAAAAVCILILISFMNGWGPDLLANIRLHLAFLLLIPALTLLWRRQRGWAAVVAVPAIGLVAICLPLVDQTVLPEGRTVYKALHFNLDKKNTKAPAFIDLLDEEQPDFVSLSEYTEDWDHAISALLAERYPHRMIEPRRDLGGLVLLSRYPIVSREIITIPGVHRPILRAEIQTPDGLVTLLGVHAESPKSNRRFASRNATLQRVAILAGQSETRGTVVLGGFNCAPWSKYFAPIHGRGGLQIPVSRGQLKATWPAWLGPAGLPLDHILLSGEVRATSYRALSGAGSDHLPVVCEFLFINSRGLNGDER